MVKTHAPVDVEALLARIDELIALHGAVTRKDFSSIKRHLPQVVSALSARGYEVSSSAIRRPIDEQLLALVESGFLPMRGLERRVIGATAREVKTNVERLLAKGTLVSVMRESGLGLLRPTTAAIDPAELAELSRRLAKIQTLVRRASSKKATRVGILRDDLVGPLASFLSSSAPANERDGGRAASSEALVLEIRRRALQSGTPTRVPELLRSIGVTMAEGHRALLDGAARGFFDLEPESGMGRLSREDAELCPAGPMGTRLSWIVVRETKGMN